MIQACVVSLLEDLAVDLVTVVNNSPGDGTAAALARLERVAVIDSPGNIGYGSAANRGRLGDSEFVVFANPDTTQSPDTVSTTVRFLQQHKRAAMVAPRMVNPDGKLYLNSQRLLTLPRMLGERLRLPIGRLRLERSPAEHGRAHQTEYVIGSYVVCRRRALDEVGWFDESIFLFGEDQDLCRRLRSADWQVWFAPVGRVVHSSGHSWKQLDDRGHALLREARLRELRREGLSFQALLYERLS